MMWHQKSRAQWIHDGDRNTRYYHLKTIKRRKKNRIVMLRNQDGEWIDDEEVLKTMVNGHFEELFADSEEGSDWQQTKYTYPHLTVDNMESLTAPFQDHEIKNAIFDMGSWKAPGPDGFPAGFYHKEWKLVADNMTNFAKDM
jgi:hypothetical protein